LAKIDEMAEAVLDFMKTIKWEEEFRNIVALNLPDPNGRDMKITHDSFENLCSLMSECDVKGVDIGGAYLIRDGEKSIRLRFHKVQTGSC